MQLGKFHKFLIFQTQSLDASCDNGRYFSKFESKNDPPGEKCHVIRG